jgi:hypothetical protein
VAKDLINNAVRLRLQVEKRRTALFAMKVTFGLRPLAKAAKAAKHFPKRVERHLPAPSRRLQT